MLYHFTMPIRQKTNALGGTHYGLRSHHRFLRGEQPDPAQRLLYYPVCRLGDVNRGYSGRVGSEQYPGLPQLAFHHALFGTDRNISGCCSHYSELLKAINRNDLFVTFHPTGRSEWPEPSQ